MAGTTLDRRPVPWIVQGDYRLEGTLEQAGAELRLRLTLSDGNEARRDVERGFADVEALVHYLREDALKELVGERAAAATIPAARQIEQMNERAAVFETLGEIDLANEIREACLLIDADDVPSIKALIASYARRVRLSPLCVVVTPTIWLSRARLIQGWDNSHFATSYPSASSTQVNSSQTSWSKTGTNPVVGPA